MNMDLAVLEAVERVDFCKDVHELFRIVNQITGKKHDVTV